MADPYASFVAQKLVRSPATGVQPPPGVGGGTLFGFQRDLVHWALRRGRAAIFANTGLGKTRMLLEWAAFVHGYTGKPVIVLAPLAVGAQTAAEAEKIGVHVVQARGPMDLERAPIAITNYERLEKFNPKHFGAVVLDESSCIKHHDTKTLATLLEAFKDTAWKLCCTATPAPNDWTELGTHAEFLGACTRAEMLSEFFVHDGGETQKWRLKGHARGAFWKWVATWGALVSHPRDLGYEDQHGYDLPPLTVREHLVRAGVPAPGYLFVMEAKGLMERRAARRDSIEDRVAACVALVRGEAWGSAAPRSSDGERPTRTDSIGSAASDTPQTQSGAPTRQKKRVGDRRTTAEMLTSSGPSGSPSPTTSGSSTSRAEDAPSAERKSPTLPAAGSQSTTATQPASSAGCSASPATSDSGSSATTPSASIALPPISAGAAAERWIVWCELNDEQDTIAEALGSEAVSIYGSLSADEKVRRYHEWAAGKYRVLISKPSIFGYGINMQHCARMAFVGVTDSWEAYYQAVRRCWRFGQKRAVEVHVFASEAEGGVVANLKRKDADAAAMAASLAAETSDAVRAEVRGLTRTTNDYSPERAMEVPAWAATA